METAKTAPLDTVRCSAIWLVLLMAPPVCATPGSVADSISTGVVEARVHKDSLLRHSPDSPIPAAEREAFSGLRYFRVDPGLRIVGDLHRYGRSRSVFFPSNTESPVEVERFGRFVFRYEGGDYWLEIVRSGNEGELSVFFTDATNGMDTYPGGRYAPIRRSALGRYVLNLNKAYNPYCAYNSDYVCPLPPQQNHLPFAVRGGELDYGADGPDLAK